MNVFNSPIPVLFRDTNIPWFTVWGSLPFSKLGRHFASPFIRSTTSLLCFTMADSSAVSATPMKGSSILSELAGTAGKLMPSFLQDDEPVEIPIGQLVLIADLDECLSQFAKAFSRLVLNQFPLEAEDII
jgi:hypothetical protein